MTQPEKTTGEMLESIGFIIKPFQEKLHLDPLNCFYTQMPFNLMWLDFALPTAQIAIEVNGAYWHGSRSASLTARQVVRTLDDSVKEHKLAQVGWKLLTIVDSDLKRKHFKNNLRDRIWDMLDV